MAKRLIARLEALEQARWARLSPLERAEELADAGVPVERWSDDELNAYCVAHSDAEALHSEVADAIQSGLVRFYGPADARPTYRVQWHVDRAVRDNIPRLCERINSLLAEQPGAVLLPLYTEDIAMLRAALSSGDVYVRAVEPDPDYMLVRRLKRPSGEIWNEQVGGELTPLGRALVSWAAQLGQVLTVEAVLRWLEGCNGTEL